jgi:hypothetical protein
MKHKFLFMALAGLMTMPVISSCDKEDDDDDTGANGVIINNTITVKVENGNDYNEEIDEVKALAYSRGSGHNEVGSGAYSNGGFTLKLLESVSEEYLESVSPEIPVFPESITISNPDVKWASIDIVAYKSGNEVGGFYYGNEDWGEASFVYVTDDVSMTGTDTDDGYVGTYNVHLKKGWNIMYQSNDSESSYELTTSVPSPMKWYYYTTGK